MPNFTLSHFNGSALSTSAGAIPDRAGTASPILPLLQGIIRGLGWHDQRAEISEHDQKAHAIAQAVEKAVTDYQRTPTASTHAKLVAALTQELKSVSEEYDYLLKQQQRYQTQADQERATTDSSTYYSWSSWSEWVTNGAKQFFGSTAVQQTEKYAGLAQARQEQIHQLETALTHLTEEAIAETSPITMNSFELKEVISSEAPQDTAQPASRHSVAHHSTSPATVFSQAHVRRLLQQPVASALDEQKNSLPLSSEGVAGIFIYGIGASLYLALLSCWCYQTCKQTKAAELSTSKEEVITEVKETKLLIRRGMFAQPPGYPTPQASNPQTSSLKQQTL